MSIESIKQMNNIGNFSDLSKKTSKSDEIDFRKVKLTDTKKAQKSVEEETLKYFKLFLTEMRHQDPYNTVETKDMTEQVLNIHLAEQAINTNRNLEKLIALSDNQTSYIGKYVQTLRMNEKVIGELKDGKLDQKFKLSEDTNKVHIIIRNADQNIVVRTETIEGKAGINNYNWDGRDNSKNKLIDGKYIIDISAIDRIGNFMDVEVFSRGKVESTFIEDKERKLILENGDIISLEDVKGVYEQADNKAQETQLNENLKKLNLYLEKLSLNNN